MSAPALSSEVRALCAEAARWRLASLLLSRPRPGWHAEVAALAAEVEDAGLAAAAAEATGAAEGPYHALLGPGGPASPREVGHRGLADPGRILADLRAAYQAFGFEPRAEEPADHVAVELDFVGYLTLKEAYAVSQGLGEPAAVTREARARFTGEHLAPLVRGLAGRLGAAEGPVARTARALASRLGEIAAGSPAAAVDPLEGGCPLAGGCDGEEDDLPAPGGR